MKSEYVWAIVGKVVCYDMKWESMVVVVMKGWREALSRWWLQFTVVLKLKTKSWCRGLVMGLSVGT